MLAIGLMLCIIMTPIVVDDAQYVGPNLRLNEFCDEAQHKCHEVIKRKLDPAFTADDIVVLVTHSDLLFSFCFVSAGLV